MATVITLVTICLGLSIVVVRNKHWHTEHNNLSTWRYNKIERLKIKEF